jgi:20S proteasome alpha/beta subunit
MDFLLGITGKDFTVIVSDRAISRSILVMKEGLLFTKY